MLKKDLLIICQYFYPDAVSTGRLPTELAEDLVSYGMSVDVLCGYPSYIIFGDDARKSVPMKELFKGINIKRLKYPNFNKNNKIGRLLNYFSFSFLVLLNAFKMREYKRILLISNPPILPYFGYISKKLFKNKFTYVIYDLYPDIAVALGAVSKGSIMVKAMNYINKKVFASADDIIVLGEDMKKYLKVHKNAQEQKIRVIQNWVDRKKINVQTKLNEFSQNEGLSDKFIVLYSGNIGLFQDLEMLIEAAKSLRDIEDIQFVFVGNGGKKGKLIQMVEQYKLDNVIFYDFQPDSIYEYVLATADCFVVTLEKEAEGLGVPSKTYTYLAAGRPLLGILSSNTDVGKMLEENDIGYRINQNDVDSLTNSILDLYHQPLMKERMGQNARIVFENNFDRHISTQKYYEIVSKC